MPTLLLDEEKCRRNISRMAEKTRRNRVTLRPHFKTHQSHEIGRWFRDEGTSEITVSSLSMAKYFERDDWKDILVAFPVNILEIDTINELAGKIRLSLLVESVETVFFLGRNLKSPVELYLKIDTGNLRTGMNWNDYSGISAILDSIDSTEKVSFTGFLTHAGNSYSSRSAAQVRMVHSESISRIVALKERFKGRYPNLKISVGDTPSCSLIEDFTMVDEIRPGNYVFYDFTQYIIGSCSTEEIAVAMACPVVAIHRERNEIIIYGGAVHFSKDNIRIGENTIFGPVVCNNGAGWGAIAEGAYLKKMSQEHGIIYAPEAIIDQYKPGEIIKVLPVHSCLTANQTREYQTLTGRKISHFQSI